MRVPLEHELQALPNALLQVSAQHEALALARVRLAVAWAGSAFGWAAGSWTPRRGCLEPAILPVCYL